ncbi:RNA-binding protein 25-like [Olea europaea var. sylvestris]|uniref:RNA-binding protein 25-like n=1 Tax=Olea europaea var. sylvestris TaxID=158386 RepID=UPI000C1D80D3|nr:RNA-binding protein 25-like [Olea europaea var. sylvestris]
MNGNRIQWHNETMVFIAALTVKRYNEIKGRKLICKLVFSSKDVVSRVYDIFPCCLLFRSFHLLTECRVVLYCICLSKSDWLFRGFNLMLMPYTLPFGILYVFIHYFIYQLDREQLQSRGTSRSEEPRIRDDRDRDREKSRERGRDREKSRERSRELSHDKPRDRDHRDDRHHRDRDRIRDRDRDRERDHGRDRDRDRERTRDRERGRDRGRDRDRDRDRHREKERDRERDYEDGDDHDRGRSRDRDYDYDHTDSKHERDHDERERNYDRIETEDNRGWLEQTDYGYGHPKLEAGYDHGHYDHYEHQGRGHYDNPEGLGVYDRYKEDPMDEEGYHYDRDTSEPQERDRDYRR